MNKSQTLKHRQENEHLRQLVEQWTRAEIMARFGRFKTLEYADYFRIKLEKEDEMRKLLFGTDSLVELAHLWGIPKRWSTDREKKKRKKQKNEKKLNLKPTFIR